MNYKYKFERFKYPDFPVYSSVQIGKGMLVIPHYHRAAEIILVLSEECEVCIDSTVFSCHKNDVVFIPPYSVHTINSNNEKTSIKGITFDLSLFGTNTENFCVETVLNKKTFVGYIQTGNTQKIAEIVKEFSMQGEENTLAFRLKILSKLYALMGLLLEKNSSAVNYQTNYLHIKPAIDYINNNYNTPISISELSELLNVCDDHFIRLFKKATNKSPIKYINDLRIEKTLKLLVDTELSISEISAEVGFSSVNYMIKVFKGIFNITPNKYRKNSKL